MATMQVQSGISEVSIGATVIRCGCGAPMSHIDAVCPTPRSSEDLGVISYWSSNPLKRWLWAARHRLEV